jgi:hypothetical protein
MTMHIEVGDYVILNSLSSRAFLAKCVAASKSGSRYKARFDHPSKEEEPAFEFQKTEVVANLGKSPSSGTAYGVKIEPLRESLDHPFWGAIYIHHELNDTTRKTLKRAMQDVHSKLKDMRITRIPLDTEIRTQVGKMAGYYKYRPKAETDILCVKLDDDLSDLEYRFSHEFAHGVWFRYFTPKMKMAWINMYHSAVAVNNYSDKDLKSLLDGIVSSGDIRAFIKENPDDAQVLRAIFKHIKQTHSVERLHFELALILEEDVSKYWPTAIELGHKQTLLTTYAEKSPEELFAEAFSLKFIGKKLPAKLDTLLDKCMRSLVKA